MNCRRKVHPFRHRPILLTVLSILMTAFFSVSCGYPREFHQSPPIPAPVMEQGMTLLWRQDIKLQALRMIEHSRTLCDLDIYELSDPEILSALTAAKHRGVAVQVVVDATEDHSQQTALPTLRATGVSVVSLHIHQGISHVKMLITDGSEGGVLLGGMNFGAGSWNNNDASVYIAHPDGSYLSLFHWDWQRAKGHPASAPGVRLPLVYDAAIREQVLSALQQSRQFVIMEAFDLSDWGVKNELKAIAQRGVLVQVLLDPGQYPNRQAAEELRRAGVTVRFYRPQQGEWMHAKILDVDHGRFFLVGSANFSHQAYTYNHEADLALHDVTGFDRSLRKDLAPLMAGGSEFPQKRVHDGGNTAVGT